MLTLPEDLSFECFFVVFSNSDLLHVVVEVQRLFVVEVLHFSVELFKARRRITLNRTLSTVVNHLLDVGDINIINAFWEWLLGLLLSTKQVFQHFIFSFVVWGISCSPQVSVVLVDVV